MSLALAVGTFIAAISALPAFISASPAFVLAPPAFLLAPPALILVLGDEDTGELAPAVDFASCHL